MSDPTRQSQHSSDDSPPPTLDEVAEAFENAWNTQDCVRIADFIPASEHPDFDDIVAELFCIDLERHFKNGNAKRISEYRREYPDFLCRAAILEKLAFEEYRLLATSSRQVDPTEYHNRYKIRTDHWPRLNEKPTCSNALISSAVTDGVSEEMERIVGVTKPLPEIGDSFLGFQIVEQLGECRFGRVYLATQKTLADRPVVIKITTNLWLESDRLAKLQHTNIVPIYSVHQEQGLQAVCMPFLGRRTLASFLSKEREHSAAEIVDSWLDGTESNDPTLLPVQQLHYLRSLSTEQLSVWIVAKIAAGLAQAHDRGIAHRDLKPANILLTDDFQPLILDFNLSDDVMVGGRGSLLVGGTLPYMAPEHLRAVVAEGHVDERGDLYSLGAILFQLLTTRLPFSTQDGSIIGNLSYLISVRAESSPSPRDVNPNLSVDIDSIVCRCLAGDPNLRYQTADELREDLERHLNYLPLKYAANRSWGERLQKWSTRHPRITSSSTVALLCAGLLFALASLAISRGNEVAKHKAVQKFRHFQTIVDSAVPALSVALNEEVVSPAIQQAESAMSVYGTDGGDWQEQEIVELLDRESRTELFADVRKLQYLVAHASLRRTRWTEGQEDRARALELARRYNTLACGQKNTEGVPQAFLLQLADIEQESGHNARADSIRSTVGNVPMLNADDQLMGAIRHIGNSDYGIASRTLLHLNEESPNDYVVSLLLGKCLYASGRLNMAEECFTRSIVLWPACYVGYFHRGICRMKSGDVSNAVADFERVTQLRPDFSTAILNRAIAKMKLKRYEDATNDLTRLTDSGRGEAIVYFLRARANDARGRVELAQADVASAMARLPTSADGWIQRSLINMATDSKAALRDLDEALLLDANSMKALQNKAAILSQLNRHEETIDVLSQLIELAAPGSIQATALLARGLVKAKLKRRQAAIEDCILGLEVQTGANHHYQAARIFAHTSTAHGPDLRLASNHIQKALEAQPNLATAMRLDQELASILDYPDVRTLLLTAESLLEAGHCVPPKPKLTAR